MLEGFINHVRENKILDFQSYYLLGISGGIDSVVLAHLLKKGGFNYGLAHCNFQLRGEESHADENFINRLGLELKVPVFVKKFDTKNYMETQGISLQMAARNLRYLWFKELYEEEQLDGILVAHHADDQLETILLNLLRGTGLEGLYGMATKRDHIIRPLLPFTRVEIKDYLKAEKLEWREDSSNQKDDYKRNFLRNRVIPELNAFDPKASELMRFSFERIKDTGKAFFHLFNKWRNDNIIREENYEYLIFQKLRELPGKNTFLQYWLKDKGFSFFQVRDILKAWENGISGKYFLSGNFMLNLDRDKFILGPIETLTQSIQVNQHDIEVIINGVTYELLNLEPDKEIDRSRDNAMVDKSLLSFPLKIRNWEEGDKFKPLGMSGFKKISDFLIDLKVPLIKKNRVKVLCSGGQIVWLVGFRIDDRFKVTRSTTSVLYFKKGNNV
ncbi:MAG: tRNA lysidine(34) synthetase TilS [Cyclobacteriaceae bacterium]